MKKIVLFLLCVSLFISCKKEPSADFEVSGSTAVGGTLVFENHSSHAESYLWDFGDKATSTLSTPTHVYKKPGQYVVTLIAEGDGGSSSVKKVLDIDGVTYSFLNSTSYDLPQFCSFYFDGNDLQYFVEHGILVKGDETNVVIAHSPEVEAGFIDGDIVYIIPGPFLLMDGRHNTIEITDDTPIYYSNKGTADNLAELFKNHFQKP
jgi:PKD repeat protein